MGMSDFPDKYAFALGPNPLVFMRIYQANHEYECPCYNRYIPLTCKCWELQDHFVSLHNKQLGDIINFF